MAIGRVTDRRGAVLPSVGVVTDRPGATCVTDRVLTDRSVCYRAEDVAGATV